MLQATPVGPHMHHMICFGTKIGNSCSGAAELWCCGGGGGGVTLKLMPVASPLLELRFRSD